MRLFFGEAVGTLMPGCITPNESLQWFPANAIRSVAWIQPSEKYHSMRVVEA